MEANWLDNDLLDLSIHQERPVPFFHIILKR